VWKRLDDFLRDGGVPQLWTEVPFMITISSVFFNVKLCFFFLNYFFKKVLN
jgi:hypothetical protein